MKIFHRHANFYKFRLEVSIRGESCSYQSLVFISKIISLHFKRVLNTYLGKMLYLEAKLAALVRYKCSTSSWLDNRCKNRVCNQGLQPLCFKSAVWMAQTDFRCLLSTFLYSHCPQSHVAEGRVCWRVHTCSLTLAGSMYKASWYLYPYLDA